MLYLASCHCGVLGASYHTELPPERWSVRACQCSFCTAHGALSTSDPAGVLEFRSSTPQQVQRYRFGTRAAEFLVCASCGIYLGARFQTGTDAYGILNIRTLRPLPADVPAAQPMDYGAESPAERRARRIARWTPLGPDSL